MRGASGGSTGLRGSRAARLTGAGIAVLLAAAAVTAYLVASAKPAPAPLRTQVLSTQVIDLVSGGPAAAATSNPPAGPGPGTGTLVASGSRLTFSSAPQASAQWTADQMAGGTYIFIYLANGGLCLSSPAAPGPAVLQRCDLAANQRWRRQGLTPGAAGTDYWQLRNSADGRCLAAGDVAGEPAQLQRCQQPPGQSQLIKFAQRS
jgi:hypothetical protein